MKRCFSIVLILALLGATIVSPAVAEEIEVVSEDVEAAADEVVEVGEAELTFEPEADAPEQTFAEAVEESSADSAAPDLTLAETVEDPTVDPAAQDTAVMAAEKTEEAPTTDETEDVEKTAAAPVATGIQLNVSSISIGLKEEYSGLTVTALPEGSKLPAITWRTDNKKKVKIDSKTGKITGVKKGTTKIYAKMEGSDEEVVCKVTVKKKPKKISMKPTSLKLGAGMAYQLTSSIPSGYASATRKYSSNNPDVATVDADGMVTAVKPGKATITVKTYNKKKATCKVTVLAEPSYVAFPDSIIPLAVNQALSLNACAMTAKDEVTPATITYAVDRGSPDPGCIELDEATGKVQGLYAGEAIVLATAQNGATGSCVVTVDVGPKSVSLNTNSIQIGVKEEYVGLLVELTPPDGAATCAQSIEWTSKNKKIAKVDRQTGVITGVKKGTCTIRATAPNGKYAECKVKVLKAPTKKSLSISPANGALKVGQSGQYKIKLSSGYGGSFTYECDNTDVAIIDNSGIVTALSPGKAVITVTTYNGIKKTANLEVTSDNSESSEEEGSKSGNEEKIAYVIKVALEKEGCPYVYGSFGPNSFDCAGFVYWCYKQVNVKLKDSAYKQGYDNRFKKIAYSDLKPGDLVFFNTVDDDDLSDHSGLYLGNGKFIHASSSGEKVIRSKMSSGYYKRNFSWGRRVFN